MEKTTKAWQIKYLEVVKDLEVFLAKPTKEGRNRLRIKYGMTL